MTLRLLLIAAAFALLGLSAALILVPGLQDRVLRPASPPVTGIATIGGPFELVDSTGKTVTQANFRGRDMLVFFGFTSCPEICPSGLQVISAALDKLGTKADAIQPIFITLDPERDTPAKMAEYIKSFHPRLIGLTGSPQQVEKVAKTYKVYHKKVQTEGASGYSIDHSSFAYLMDAEGRFISHFSPSTDADALATAIAKVL